MEELEKIDILRRRTGVNYRRAKEVLEESGGDVVDALIALEKKEDIKKDQFYVKGSELLEHVKRLLHEGNVNRIRVRHQDRTILEIPVTFGAVGAVMAPSLAVLGSLAALLSGATLEIEREKKCEPEAAEETEIRPENIFG